MKFEKALRLQKLPPYLFAEIDKKKKKAISEGRDIINLGIGDPDQPTPDFIIDEMAKQIRRPENHQYALDMGLPKLRQAIADWHKKHYSVELDPDNEIWPLIGSKEGIAHLPLAMINPGDYVLVPEPCYPPYRSGTFFAEGIPHYMPLLEKNGFLPDLDAIGADVLDKAKLMHLNYPNNPTAACATRAFYEKVVQFALDNNVFISQDAAYMEMFYEDRPVSFLEIEGAKDVGVEFHSFSKTFNMTGWRIAWVAGNADMVKALGQIKSNLDSGIFQAMQYAGITALEDTSDFLDSMRGLYKKRRDVLFEGLQKNGFSVTKPQATFYVWVKISNGMSSTDFCSLLLDKADIVTTPGVGFGAAGEGYFRIALTVSEKRLAEAVERMRKVLG